MKKLVLLCCVALSSLTGMPVLGAETPDLAVTDVMITKADYVIGEAIPLTVTVTNEGTENVSSLTLSFTLMKRRSPSRAISSPCFPDVKRNSLPKSLPR